MIQNLSARLQTLFVLIGLLGGFMGMELPGDVSTWDGNTVNVVLTWLTAMGSRAAIKTLKPRP